MPSVFRVVKRIDKEIEYMIPADSEDDARRLFDEYGEHMTPWVEGEDEDDPEILSVQEIPEGSLCVENVVADFEAAKKKSET